MLTLTAVPAVAPALVSEETIALNRAIKRAWKAHITDTSATAAQHAVYALLRGKALDKTFSPLKNPGKIAAQGGVADRARRDAEWEARRLSTAAWAPFAGLLEGVGTKAGCYLRAPHPLLDRVEAP